MKVGEAEEVEEVEDSDDDTETRLIAREELEEARDREKEDGGAASRCVRWFRIARRCGDRRRRGELIRWAELGPSLAESVRSTRLSKSQSSVRPLGRPHVYRCPCAFIKSRQKKNALVNPLHLAPRSVHRTNQKKLCTNMHVNR